MVLHLLPWPRYPCLLVVHIQVWFTRNGSTLGAISIKISLWVMSFRCGNLVDVWLIAMVNKSPAGGSDMTKVAHEKKSHLEQEMLEPTMATYGRTDMMVIAMVVLMMVIVMVMVLV